MSRFVKNLRRSGIEFSRRYSSRGRKGIFGGGSVEFSATFPAPDFIKAVEKKERIVLYSTGRYAMRAYRTQLRRRPPEKKTKRGRIRKRYKEEVIDKKIRPPYFRTGILYRSVDFVVNLNQGAFDAGPPKISGLQKFTKSRKAVPGLLEHGGPAMVRVGRRKKRTKNGLDKPVQQIWEQRTYRRFPYQGLVYTFSLAFFRRKLRETPLQL